MSRPATVSRSDVLLRLRRAFRAGGYEGTTLATLSEQTGLAKAALYHYFPDGKAAMAAAVLGDLGAWNTEHVLQPLNLPGDPRDRLQEMAVALGELYDGGQDACLVGLFSTGEALRRFPDHLQRSLADLIAAISGVLVDAGIPPQTARERAEDAVIRIQGALVVARVLRDTGPFTRTLRRLPDQLLDIRPQT